MEVCMIIPKFTIDQNIVNNEIKILNNILIQQRCLKQTLALYLKKISDGIYNASDTKDSNSLISCLNGIQKSFDNIKNNINQIIELKKYIEKALFSPCDTNYFETYNENFMKLFEKISEDNIFYYSFMESLLKFMEVNFPDIKAPKLPEHKISSNSINTIAESTINSKELNSEGSVNRKSNKDIIIKQLEKATIAEKTLIISEKNKNAILPYTTNELENYFSNFPEKYSSIQDIIDKEYTISTKSFHNASMSRFKETFNLARKSNLTFIKSLNLANELFFNSNVNPIIIRACKSIDELYIYLSCLEDNILNEFKCFKIIYTH